MENIKKHFIIVIDESKQIDKKMNFYQEHI